MAFERLTLDEIVEQLDQKVKTLRIELAEAEVQQKHARALKNGQRELPIEDQPQAGTATGLTNAVLNSVERLAKDRLVPHQTITKALLEQDFQPRGKHFSTSVYLTLKRLAKAKRVKHDVIEGSHHFGCRNGHN